MKSKLAVTDGWVRAHRGALPLSPGDELPGGYRILSWRASGGTGHIFEAQHPRLGVPVAVKVPRAELAHSPETRQRFESEAEVLAILKHPHIVRLLDFDSTETGVPFLVMELLAGSDVRSRMAPGVSWAPASLARMIRQIAQALSFAHRHGIVHRDLKPENLILIPKPGDIEDLKILDFGLSRIQGRRLTPVDTDTTLGTPGYMSPEQISGGHVDGRSDQFNLAVLAFELLTGWPCFRGDNNLSIMYQIVNGRPPPLPAAARRPSPAVEAVFARALSVDPRQRYSSIGEFAEVLLATLFRSPSRSRSRSFRVERRVPPKRQPAECASVRRRATVRSLRTAAAFVAGLTVFGAAGPPSTTSLRRLHVWALGEGGSRPTANRRLPHRAPRECNVAAPQGTVLRTGLAMSGLGHAPVRMAGSQSAACPTTP